MGSSVVIRGVCARDSALHQLQMLAPSVYTDAVERVERLGHAVAGGAQGRDARVLEANSLREHVLGDR